MQTTRTPGQVWLLFWGTLFSSTGMALVWPFLTIYIREQFDVPLTTVTTLVTVQSVTGFAATAAISPLLDRLGRRWPMIIGLVGSSAVMLVMTRAGALWQWALLLPVYATVNSVFRVGSYTMLADMVTGEQRTRMYALLRMGDNVGISAGPAVGGFLVAVDYALSFYLAASVQIVLAGFALAMLAETLPTEAAADTSAPSISGGYRVLFTDLAFMRIWGFYLLVQIANAMVFVLLGLYLKENFGITEDRYGFIVGVNAAMVVLFQYAVTRITSHRAPLPVITSGALLYAAGLLGFALSTGFMGFLVGMVILTVGELILIPTATALVSEIAPVAMRARYMGVFSLSFRVGSAVGPVIGGLLADHIAPAATWYGGVVVCLLAAVGYATLAWRER